MLTFNDLQFRQPTNAEKAEFINTYFNSNAEVALLHAVAVLTGHSFEDLWLMNIEDVIAANQQIINLWGGNPKRWARAAAGLG
jgi:hypothetical protein